MHSIKRSIKKTGIGINLLISFVYGSSLCLTDSLHSETSLRKVLPIDISKSCNCGSINISFVLNVPVMSYNKYHVSFMYSLNKENI